MKFSHTPVMLDECLNALNLGTGMTVIDATLGGGGHSKAILEKITPGGHLIAIDKDIVAIEHNKTELTGQSATLVHSDFSEIAKAAGGQKIDAILADLGVSSYQIDTAERGFSYMAEANLDMRMDTTRGKTASDVINYYPPSRLFEIIRDYGEERHARKIADAIIAARPIHTTQQLAEICKSACPQNYYKTGGHPAKRTFQAIRIEVNTELESLKNFLVNAIAVLAKGGRMAVITFHSLEDRIVKQTFKLYPTGCICPPRTPQCICGHKASVKILTKKPILPSTAEQKANPRSHSAKLRVIEKI